MTAIQEIEELIETLKGAIQALELALDVLRTAGKGRTKAELTPMYPGQRASIPNYLLGQVNQQASVQEIAAHLGIKPSATNQRLLVLKKKKLVRRVKRGVYAAR
jgi:predicted Rossmann fold nucleotide-binding protein DprA/Smf involved in DNA uptake